MQLRCGPGPCWCLPAHSSYPGPWGFLLQQIPRAPPAHAHLTHREEPNCYQSISVTFCYCGKIPEWINPQEEILFPLDHVCRGVRPWSPAWLIALRMWGGRTSWQKGTVGNAAHLIAARNRVEESEIYPPALFLLFLTNHSAMNSAMD